MIEVSLDYGTSHMKIELPDTSIVLRYGQHYEDPPKVDPIKSTRKALDNPLGLPPLTKLAGPDKTAVIVFPDRVKGGAHPHAHRRISIPMIIKDLLKGGCHLENITLMCAQGLHRRNTYEEWLWYLGPEIVMCSTKHLTCSLSNDTGTGHMLSTNLCPQLKLFCKYDPVKFTPKSRIIKIISSQEFNSKNINSIPVKEVIEKIEDLILSNQ